MDRKRRADMESVKKQKYFYILLCIMLVIFVQICPADEMHVPEAVEKTGKDICNIVSRALKPENTYICDDRYMVRYEGKGKRNVAIYDLNSLNYNTFDDYVIGDRRNGNFSFTENMKEIFLAYGMKNTSFKYIPYYTYYDSEDALLLELYFDGKQCGCGICHDDFWEEYAGEIKGFVFSECHERQWKESDYCVTITGLDLESCKKDARNYKEWFEYNEAGQVTEFHAQAEFNWDSDEWFLTDIASCYCKYYDDGTLKMREIYKDSRFFETWNSIQRCYYDETGRIVYIWSYVTHGSMEYYFIYEDDSDIPAYSISIDNYSGECIPAFFKYTKE